MTDHGQGAETIDASLAGVIQEQIRSGKVELPVLPEVALKVQEVVARDGDIEEIVSQIEREPVLSASLLRYANSVAFAGLKEITDLKQAVTRLGLQSVEQTVVALSARNAFKPTDKRDVKIYRTLWNHSVTTALAARRLSAFTPGISPDLAFLGGLLHDIGKIVILRCAAQLRARNPERYSFEDSALAEFFDSLHCTVGESLFDSWNIPEEIRRVIRRHHEKTFTAPDDLLVAVVSFADDVARKLGISLNPDQELPLLDSPATDLIRVDDLKLANLLVDLEDDLAAFEQSL